MNLNAGDTGHDANFCQELKITWTFPDFRSLPAATEYFLDSPPFMMFNAAWCLRVYPNVKASEAEVSHVGFLLVRLRSLVPHHTVTYKLTFSDHYDVTTIPRVDDFDEDHTENGSMNFITRSKALNRWNRNRAFKLKCKMICRSPPVDTFSEVEQLMAITKENEALRQNMKNAFQSGQSHDVILNVQGEEIRAHKDILRFRSPVFEAMLTHNMMETGHRTVDVPDCDPQAFRQFLLYLYSAEVETLDAENVLALYHIAHKYEVEHLKEKCCDFIKQQSSPSNITHIIQYALNFNDIQLLECATQYFLKNFHLILVTMEWQVYMQHNDFQANQLLVKVLENVNGNGMN